jgi:hypothetical protein
MLQEEDNDIDLGEYGLGTFRSHWSYQLYAGIHFRLRKLHPDAVKGIDPPTTSESEGMDWAYVVKRDQTLNLDWQDHWDALKSQTRCTCVFDFIYLGVESEDGEVLYREDLTEEEYLRGTTVTKIVRFTSSKVPSKLILWPHKREGDWLERVDIKL